jgi:hypothetical protein
MNCKEPYWKVLNCTEPTELYFTVLYWTELYWIVLNCTEPSTLSLKLEIFKLRNDQPTVFQKQIIFGSPMIIMFMCWQKTA